MVTRKFYIDGQTASVIAENEKFLILETNVWVFKATMRTLGDDRKAVDVTDRDVTTLDQEMLVREVVYPRLVCALSELRLKIEAFCAEFSEDNVPSELFTTADDISEMVTGLYVFLDRNTNGHKPTEELRR